MFKLLSACVDVKKVNVKIEKKKHICNDKREWYSTIALKR